MGMDACANADACRQKVALLNPKLPARMEQLVTVFQATWPHPLLIHCWGYAQGGQVCQHDGHQPTRGDLRNAPGASAC